MEDIGSASPKYKAYLEEVPGIGRNYIQSIICKSLRNFKYEYENSKKEIRETYCIVEFHGVKSEKLSKALAESTISAIELVRPGKATGLDTGGIVTPRDEILRLTVRAQTHDTVGLIRKIRSWANDHDWSDVKVLFRMPEDRSRVVTVAREADAIDVLFVRAEQINVMKPMDVCAETVNEELVAKALDLWRSAGGE